MLPEKVTNLSRLDECIRWVDAAPSSEERQHRLEQFYFEPDLTRLRTLDPFSPDYRAEVLKLYADLRDGAVYDEATAEANHFDLEAFKRHPYPFNTGDKCSIGEHVAAGALIVRDFPKPSGARVLELGPGCGNLALMLARTGYQVTGFDMEQRYLDLIDHWAGVFGVAERVKTVAGKFSEFDLPGPFDAVLFFSSFHHSFEHVDLLRRVRAALAPDGVVCFAGEPVELDYDVPWRLRTDSLAAYCTRRAGWMELGFRDDYFTRMLYRTGFIVERRHYADCKSASGYVGRPFKGRVSPNQMYLRDGWNLPDISDFRWTSGPASLTLPETGSCISLSVVNHRPEQMKVEFTALSNADERKLGELSLAPAESAAVEFSYTPEDTDLRLLCASWKPADYGSTDPRQLGIGVIEVGVM